MKKLANYWLFRNCNLDVLTSGLLIRQALSFVLNRYGFRLEKADCKS